jgi:hypothetical protein
MAATVIMIRLKSVVVLDRRSHGEWSFEVSAKHLPSNRNESPRNASGGPFEAITRRTIDLGDACAFGVTIAPDDTRIEITVAGYNSGGGGGTGDLGKVLVTLNIPIMHNYDISLRSSAGLFTARVLVSVTRDPEREAGEITTILTAPGGGNYNTIHDGMQSRVVHICPVIPVPWATGIPAVPRSLASLSASDPEALHIGAETGRLNALVNPAVIPVLDPSQTWFDSRVARIRITQFRPRNLDLRKLVWKAATDNIRFFDGGAGKTEVKGVDSREVKAYGVPRGNNDAMGTIEVRWDEPGQPLLAVYRAWVGRARYLHYRANIIKCGSRAIGGVPVQNPTVTVAKVRNRLAFNAILLWQVGIRLVPDPDETCYNGAASKGNGIFEVSLRANQTFNMNPDASDANYYPTILNQREGIINICYIHSHSGGNPSGLARDRMRSPASTTETQGGSPSTSWVFPTGVYPDGGGRTVRMMTMGPSTRRPDTQQSLAGDGDLAHVCGLTIADWAANIADANTEAHEIGHVLGLHHRGSGGYEDTTVMGESVDKVNHLAGPYSGKGHPWDENIMSYSSYDRAQDFDLIQAKVVRKHPLLRRGRLTAGSST